MIIAENILTKVPITLFAAGNIKASESGYCRLTACSLQGCLCRAWTAVPCAFYCDDNRTPNNCDVYLVCAPRLLAFYWVLGNFIPNCIIHGPSMFPSLWRRIILNPLLDLNKHNRPINLTWIMLLMETQQNPGQQKPNTQKPQVFPPCCEQPGEPTK